MRAPKLRPPKIQDSCPPLTTFQKVRPVLHHLRPGLQMQCVIVGCTDRIPWGMSKLKFDVIVSIALLMQNCGGESTEPMACHPALVAHPFKALQDRVVAHGLTLTPMAGEYP